MDEEPPNSFDDAIRALLSDEDGALGCVQVVCLPIGHWTDRVGTFFAHLLCLFEDDKRVFERLCVVAPPDTDRDATRTRLAEAVDAAMLRAGAQPSDGRIDRLAEGIDLIITDDLVTDTVLGLTADTPPDRAIAVAYAARYRASGLVNSSAPGTAAILGSDETWVPHLCRMAEAFAERDADGVGFTILDTGMLRPSDGQLERIKNMVGYAILTEMPDDDPEAKVDDQLPQWRIWIGEGRIGRVLQELDAIQGMEEPSRRAVRIQLMDAAGLSQQALAELRLLETTGLPPSISTKLAMIAAQAGATRLATDLLTPVAASLTSREDLHNALRAADRADDDGLANIVSETLQRLFPGSANLRAFRYRQALADGDHAAAAILVPPGSEGSEAAAFHRALADAFAVDAVPDYGAVIDACGGDAASVLRTIAACAADALRRGAIMHAFELCLDPRVAIADAGSWTLLSTVEQLLINRPGGKMAVSLDRIADAVAILLRRLATHPANTALRSSLMDLLDPAVAGDEGLPIVLRLLLEAAAAPLDPTAAPDLAEGPPFDELIADPAFRGPMERWMRCESPIQVGLTPFPVDELSIMPDEACSSILAYLAHVGDHGAAPEPGDGQDARTIILGLGTAIALHASDPDIDIKMIRTTAVGMAVGGARQPARDLAETLLFRANTPRRRRLAWIGLADVYHRCGDRLLSALYATAGLMADTNVDDDQLWHETLLIHRVLRDNGLADQAMSVLAVAEQVLDRMGRAERYSHRIETMRIQVRLGQLQYADHPAAEVAVLRAAAVANARNVIERHDARAPVASLVTQLNRFARELGLPPDAEALAVEAELRGDLGDSLARQVDISGRDVPTSDDLLALVAAMHPARYSEDVGKDAQAAAMAARRALDADETLANPESASLVIEICCDRAIAMPGWDGARLPPAMLEGVEGPASVAAAISKSGITVLQAAFGHDGLLVKVVAQDGVLKAEREPESAITLERLKAWSARYPYAYGTEELDANRFFTSTEALSLTGIGTGAATLVVGDKHLRSMPPNLSRVGAGFAGETQPMAAAPSLTWLRAAVAAARQGDGRRVAWISSADSKGTTLATLGDRMEETLESHGFTLDRDRTLPGGFTGASMAVVAAHGGLNRNSNAFQVVSDEGMLTVTAEALGAALHNVGVVALFVCSGGRSDAHPTADATIGLARQLLDQGAQAVVASPWPLESIVPPPWLEAFLDRWDAGDRLIDAVHAANAQMLVRWPHDHAKGLAMNVLGNPLLRTDR